MESSGRLAILSELCEAPLSHVLTESANEAQLQEIKTQFLAIEAKLAAATTLHQIQALKVQSRQALANLNV